MGAHEEVETSELCHRAGMARRCFWRCVPDVGRYNCVKVFGPEVHKLQA